MEVVCISIAILCMFYVMSVHKDYDRALEENLLLRKSLNKLASGEANIYRRNGALHIEEIE